MDIYRVLKDFEKMNKSVGIDLCNSGERTSETYIQSQDGKWHVVQDNFPELNERIRPPLLHQWEIMASIIADVMKEEEYE